MLISADVAKLAYAQDLGSCVSDVQVRPLSSAPEKDLNFDKKLRSFSAKSVLRRDKSATQMKSLRDEILLMQGYKDGFNFIQICLDFIVLCTI